MLVTDGQQVLTSGTDNSLQLWDARDGSHPRVAIHRHVDAVNAVLFDPSGPSLLSASDDGTVRFDRCNYCSLPLAQLQERARERVQLIAPLDRAGGPADGRFKWPGWPRWLGGG